MSDDQNKDCNGCGACCLHMAVPPYDDDELLGMPDIVRDEMVGVRKTRSIQFAIYGTDYIPCGFFNPITRQCRHYENRPAVCRAYEAGSDSCISLQVSINEGIGIGFAKKLQAQAMVQDQYRRPSTSKPPNQHKEPNNERPIT